ncbi:MAG: hypothetical protein WKF55_00755 [Gemmatimonadaceae bacterium]
MTEILVVGSDPTLIEGVVQTLAAAEHRVTIASDISEAIVALGGRRPLVAIVDRAELFSDGTSFRIPLALGGALVAYHRDETKPTPLPFPVQRAILASLELPLERKRLVALVAKVEARAQATGRAEITESRPANLPDRF